MQLDLFPTTVHLRCIDPAKKQAALLWPAAAENPVRAMGRRPRMWAYRQRGGPTPGAMVRQPRRSPCLHEPAGRGKAPAWVSLTADSKEFNGLAL